MVSLDEVDVFWKKLDFNPSLIVEEEVDYVQEMGDVTRELLSQSPNVKKSLFSKVKEVIYPFLSMRQLWVWEGPQPRPSIFVCKC